MKVHFVGCNGVSMSMLRELAAACRIHTSGSDDILGGHSASNIAGADLVVYSSAIQSDNVELLEATRLGIPIMSRAELLGLVSMDYSSVIAVAGSHGKTTTTGMVGSVLYDRYATVHVGGNIRGRGKNCIGGKEFFVTEACEYKASFLSLSPSIGIILNIEHDHVDYYKTADMYNNAFVEFASRCECTIINSAYAHIISGISGKVVTFGGQGDYRASNICPVRYDKGGTGLEFDVLYKGNNIGRFRLSIIGSHNIDNALACIAACVELGIGVGEIYTGLEQFVGVGRRFEIMDTEYRGIVVNDYAHHPTEIDASIDVARGMLQDRGSKGKLRVVFQPHTYTRTAALYQQFAHSLGAADVVALVPIYAAREHSDTVTSRLIGDCVPHCRCYNDLESAKEFLQLANDEDITIVMGAGDIDSILPHNKQDKGFVRGNKIDSRAVLATRLSNYIETNKP